MKVSPSFTVGLFLLLPLCARAQDYRPLIYAPAPIDNPLKGFVPYDGDRHQECFPHSLEWFYQPLAPIMTAPGVFNWQPIEKHLAQIAARGHQAVFRIYLDYPGTVPGTPRYLLDAGLKTHAYEEQKNQGRSVSPDYEDSAPARGDGRIYRRLWRALRRRSAHRLYHGGPAGLLGRMA